jgi:excisionase family DNA binding protein
MHNEADSTRDIAPKPAKPAAFIEWQSLRSDPLLSLGECCETLHVSRDSLKRWMRAGKLRGCKVGGRWKVRRSQALNLIREMNP